MATVDLPNTKRTVNSSKIFPAMKRSDTLVVLGNGPSLEGFDFARLRPFDVIGMNAAYRYWDEIGWYPTYYICLDTVGSGVR